MYGKSNIFAGSFYVFVNWMREQTMAIKSQEKSQMNFDSKNSAREKNSKWRNEHGNHFYDFFTICN